MALTGVLPGGLYGGLPELRYIYLDNNLLTGPLPSDWFAHDTLQHLSLSHNNFATYALPSTIALPSLTRLHVHSAP